MTGTQRPRARRLEIVIKTSPGTLPVLVAAGLFSAAACGDSGDVTVASVGAAGSIAFGAGGFATGGSIFSKAGGAGVTFTFSGGSPGTGGSCNYTVPLPLEGVPADPGQICAVVSDPVNSNYSARVTFAYDTAGGVTGMVTFDPAVEQRLVGVPIVEVLDATNPQLTALVIGPLTKVAGGYSFRVGFPQGVVLDPGYSRLTVRTTFDVDCGADGSAAKQVHAATDIHLCNDPGYGPTWVSSGDQCSVCRIIAEMAPSPIVPDKAADGLPLAKAMRLRVVELARVTNRVVLFAENDGGDGLDYEWHPSAGTIERLAPDVIVWTVAEGMAAPLMQVAVSGDSEAAVATFAWNQAA